MSTYTTLIGPATVTGKPVLYSSVAVTTSGLSLDSGHTYSVQWIARGTQSAQASQGTITITSNDISACELSFATTEAVALFHGKRQDPLTGRLIVWDRTASRVYALGDLELYYSPNPGDVTTTSVTTAATFLALTDTPSAFTAGYWVKVNAAGTALEFSTAPLLLDQTTVQTVTGGTPVFAAGLTAQATTGRSAYVYRNDATATAEVMKVYQDHASDDEHALVVAQDGTGDIIRGMDGLVKVFAIQDGGTMVVAGTANMRDVKALGDAYKFLAGAGSDASLYYDGTVGYVETDLVAPSDLYVKCGAAKTLVLSTAVYKDINFGALTFVTGGTLPGVVELVNNAGAGTGIYGRGFAVNEQGSFCFEYNHECKAASDITLHVHWCGQDAPTGTDYVNWRMIASVCRDGAVTPAVITDDTETAIDTQYKWYRTDFAVIPGATGGPGGTALAIGDQIWVTILRVAASGAAYAGEALVSTAGAHVQVDTLGSRLISTK